MNRILPSILPLLIFSASGCDILNPTQVPLSYYVPIDYKEIPLSQIPPCLQPYEYFPEWVLTSTNDYDSLKIEHAPQGPYQEFIADGIQTHFKLSYQPLDANHNGKIDPNDIIIYMDGKPILVFFQGDTIKVGMFWTVNDSLLIFNDTTGFLERAIPVEIVYSVNPITGEVIFVSSPPQGNHLQIGAVRSLYDTYQGRQCNMDYFDFSKYSIIYKQVHAGFPDCVFGLDLQVFRDDLHRLILVRYKPEIEYHTGRCGESTVISKWISIDRIPSGFTVQFEEIK